MLQKLSGDTNALTWFEIPIADVKRAKQFYETILDIKMTEPTTAHEEETSFFPRKPDTIMALSGIVSGSLVKADRVKPGSDGPLIYLNATPSLGPVLEKVEAAGGKIVMPSTKIPAGLIAVILDTEGNKIGLNAAN